MKRKRAEKENGEGAQDRHKKTQRRQKDNRQNRILFHFGGFFSLFCLATQIFVVVWFRFHINFVFVWCGHTTLNKHTYTTRDANTTGIECVPWPLYNLSIRLKQIQPKCTFISWSLFACQTKYVRVLTCCRSSSIVVLFSLATSFFSFSFFFWAKISISESQRRPNIAFYVLTLVLSCCHSIFDWLLCIYHVYSHALSTILSHAIYYIERTLCDHHRWEKVERPFSYRQSSYSIGGICNACKELYQTDNRKEFWTEAQGYITYITTKYHSFINRPDFTC